MSGPAWRSFYRLARTVPPGEDEYLTLAQRHGGQPRRADELRRRASTGLSAFDSPEGARAQGVRVPRLGKKIVKYDLPVNGPFRWEQTFAAGHFTIYGDLAVLKDYRDPAFEEDVE